MASTTVVSTRLQRVHDILHSIKDIVGDNESVQEVALGMLERTRNEIVAPKGQTRLQQIHGTLQSIQVLVGDSESLEEIALAMLERTRIEIVMRKNEIFRYKRQRSFPAVERNGGNASLGLSDEIGAGQITEFLPNKVKSTNRQNDENYEVAVELMKWMLVFTRDFKGESKFTKIFLSKGFEGYRSFRREIRNITAIVCKHRYPHDDDKAKAMLKRFDRKGGSLDHAILNMKSYFCDTVKTRMPKNEWTELVSPAHEQHMLNLLTDWSKLLLNCRDMTRVQSTVGHE